MQTVTIYKKDLLPNIKMKITDRCGDVVDLTTATAVRFYMGELGVTPLIVNGVLCTVQDAENGIVLYTWQAGQTDTPGDYVGELVIFDSTNKPHTAGQFTVRILDSLH